MGSKPFWKSKTLWVNVIAMVATLLNSAVDGLDMGGDETAALFVVINVIMRAVTKGSVTLA